MCVCVLKEQNGERRRNRETEKETEREKKKRDSECVFGCEKHDPPLSAQLLFCSKYVLEGSKPN